MSEEDQTPPARTVLQRMVKAGISEDRARDHISRGWVRLGGGNIVVTDPDTLDPSESGPTITSI
jgi:hypothetical protein